MVVLMVAESYDAMKWHVASERLLRLWWNAQIRRDLNSVLFMKKMFSVVRLTSDPSLHFAKRNWPIHTTSLLLQDVCYAEPCISYGRVVSPSVTRWHWVKTTQASITKSSPTDSPRTSWRWKDRPEIRKGSPPARALNERGRKKLQFSANKSLYLSNGARHDQSYTVSD